jgi:hypothetical protein
MVTGETTPSICDKSHAIKVSLNSLLLHLKDRPEASQHVKPVEDLLARFKLWAGNLGALHQPSSNMSLDHRLGQPSRIRSQVFQHLDQLQEAVDDGKLDGFCPCP